MPNIYRFLIKTLCFSVIITITMTNGQCRQVINNGCLACWCTDIDSCYYEYENEKQCAEGEDPYLYSGTYKCTYDEVIQFCAGYGCELSCTNEDALGCTNWKCTGCTATDNGEIQRCETGGANKEYSYKPTNGSCGNCYNAYYSEGCCRPREIMDTCDYNYKYKNNGFPTSLWPEQECISDTNIKNTISVTCANEYYIIPGSTVTFTVGYRQDAYWSDDKIEITDCSGCSTEKCKPQTPASCYNSNTDCLSEEKDGKNLKYEWIQCKRNDPNSCGFSSTDDLYKNKIKTHADNTYVRQKFYDYDTTKQSCEIKWGEIDCATDGYELNTDNICVACPAGTYAEYATTDGVRKRKCKNCPKGNSTFTDDNKDGIIDKFTTGNTSVSNCEPCPAGYIQISTTRKCSKCAEGTYNSLKGQSNTTNKCPYTCPTNFTTDTEDLNDSIQMCYINPNVKLSDSLGTITLSEEIGSGTKLYYQ